MLEAVGSEDVDDELVEPAPRPEGALIGDDGKRRLFEGQTVLLRRSMRATRGPP